MRLDNPQYTQNPCHPSQHSTMMVVSGEPATLALKILIFLCCCLDIDYVSGTEPTVPWYENLPAVAMDYKVHIDPGKEDCYYQYVNVGATFYVSFQVVRGGDGQAGFAVRNPKGEIVHPYQWKPNSEYQDQTSMGGYYSVCIDNQFSRFAGKLVNIYLTVVRYDMWEQYTKEVEELNMNMDNFTSTIMDVERNINHMLQFQHHTRGREAWDLSLLTGNNSYVVRWSLIQIVVIGLTTVVQVYFVRKLFDTKTGSGFSKSRI